MRLMTGITATNVPFGLRLLASGATLVLGLMALGYIYPDEAIATDGLTKAGRLLVPLGYVVMVFEALVFTIAPAELSLRWLRQPLPGLALGWLLYVPVLHWSHGWAGLAASGWIAAMVGLGYVIERGASAWRAAFHAAALKCLFWTIAWPALLAG
jgi:hypothetical protein